MRKKKWRTLPVAGGAPCNSPLTSSAHSEILRFTLSKVCHSERSEESALVRLGPELQILRFAQDDSDFHLHGWAQARVHSDDKVKTQAHLTRFPGTFLPFW